jgi:hypothetical protein
MFTRPGGQPFDSYCSSLFGILYGPGLLLMKVLVLPSFEKKRQFIEIYLLMMKLELRLCLSEAEDNIQAMLI